jgi:predicted aspartyl protease
MLNVHAFTRTYNTISNVLTLPVKITLKGTDGEYQTEGIIDTGATGSVISQHIADTLGAAPQTFVQVHTASAKNVITPLYEADIELNGQVKISGLMVTSGELIQGTECLIGMDILSQGDLSVTNHAGQTCLSFRIPSLKRIDFVADAKAHTPLIATQKPQRNDPCPCGSGKKYKNCCAK